MLSHLAIANIQRLVAYIFKKHLHINIQCFRPIESLDMEMSYCFLFFWKHSQLLSIEPYP